jgi:hypothetical protein
MVWHIDDPTILRGDELLSALRENSLHPGIITGWRCKEHGLVTPHTVRCLAADGDEFVACGFCFNESPDISVPVPARLKPLEEVMRERSERIFGGGGDN